MNNLIISRAALADIQRLRSFLAEKDPAAAQRAVAAIERAMHSLDIFPERGRPTGTQGLRELIVTFGRHGYVMRYAYLAETDEVVIVRIWHGREQRQ